MRRIISLSLFFFLLSRDSFALVNITERNSDIVNVGPYYTVANGTANAGSQNGTTSLDFIMDGEIKRDGRRSLLRQNGTIVEVDVAIQSVSHMTGFYLTVWRFNIADSNFDLVGKSENILSNLSAGGIAHIELSSPITGVQVGDFQGVSITYDGGSAVNGMYWANTGDGDNIIFYVFNNPPTTTDYPWTTKTAATNYIYPWKAYMQAPNSVFIGDSIIGGIPNIGSFIDNYEITGTYTLNSDIPGALNALLGGDFVYQNMAIAGQTITQIEARFTTDVVDLKPKVAFLEGGVNDVGTTSEATFQTKWGSILDACVANSITPVVLLIMPCTNLSNANMQIRDDWNAWLAGEAVSHGGVAVDLDSTLGQFRVGGDAGNLWDIKTSPDYNADGTHFEIAGYAAAAQYLFDNVVTEQTQTPQLITTVSS